jgi:hypothetical protein
VAVLLEPAVEVENHNPNILRYGFTTRSASLASVRTK